MLDAGDGPPPAEDDDIEWEHAAAENTTMASDSDVRAAAVGRIPERRAWYTDTMDVSSWAE
jgi:hypothetical protein